MLLCMQYRLVQHHIPGHIQVTTMVLGRTGGRCKAGSEARFVSTPARMLSPVSTAQHLVPGILENTSFFVHVIASDTFLITVRSHPIEVT